ncbi:MAG: thymidine phosphorylase [Chloroflexota bacterium]|nr:thymidine phosphorylase [Chloroflexota bacterium]
MNAVDIIVKKRDGHALTPAEIEFFISGYSDETIPDYQAAALAMAIYFQGMDDDEATALTLAMLHSGHQLTPQDAFPPDTIVVDKHSTGGVGDKTTLVVAPIVASLGLPVGKLSGRGLGFSGGTLDKLESIDGMDIQVPAEQFTRQLQEIGLVIGGQTAELAPADGKLYALRDVTGTVPVLPLMASSIMSKKLAAGADAIVLDVKVGYGAFMQDLENASHLASLMVEIGKESQRAMSAVISDMNQPLGWAVGNALELREAIQTLRGAGPRDLVLLATTLAGEMLHLGGKVADPSEGRQLALSQLANGQAWQKFRQFVAAQGGDLKQVDQPDQLPIARIIEPVLAPAGGWIQEIRADEVGIAAVNLGGGRALKTDAIDPAVGVVLEVKVADRIESEEPIAWIHANDEKKLADARQRISAATKIASEPTEPIELIHEIIR